MEKEGSDLFRMQQVSLSTSSACFFLVLSSSQFDNFPKDDIIGRERPSFLLFVATTPTKGGGRGPIELERKIQLAGRRSYNYTKYST